VAKTYPKTTFVRGRGPSATKGPRQHQRYRDLCRGQDPTRGIGICAPGTYCRIQLFAIVLDISVVNDVTRIIKLQVLFIDSEENRTLKYLKLYIGPEKLNFLMKEALKSDPLAHVSLMVDLAALDRRLVKMLQIVAGCIETLSISNIVIDNGL